MPMEVVDLKRAISRALRQGAPIVRNYAVLNVTGRVLKSRTGQLAKSIRTRVSKTNFGGVLSVGTNIFYGRLWEKGFKHRGRSARKLRSTKPGKVMAPRPWLHPAAEQAIPEIGKLINLEIQGELKANFSKLPTIEIKLS
jgi:hypothetical protein